MLPEDPRHGTNAGYIAHALHDRDYCQPCRDAHRNYRKRAKIRMDRTGPVKLDSTGTIRRIQALLALGHTHASISASVGASINLSKNASSSRYDYVHADVAQAIRDAYDKLSMTIATGWRAEECRRRAIARGYHPPLAWDDDMIDQKDARPNTAHNENKEYKFHKKSEQTDWAVVERILTGEATLPTTAAEKREVVRRWPGTLNDLARLTGWKVERYGSRSGGVAGDRFTDDNDVEGAA